VVYWKALNEATSVKDGKLHLQVLTWSKTSRPCARCGVAAGVGAADVPGQRRWIRLTFAGRDGMTGNRRELPLSKVAGHPRGVPHRAFEGSSWGWDHPLPQPSRAWGRAV